MIGLVFRLELLKWRRDPRLLTILCATAAVLVAATAWATAADIAQRDAREQAMHEARAQWEGRGAENPHGMAHFGDFAFRPSGPLARLDRGVQARLGKVLFLEGHRQGTPMHADTARAGTAARFARPDAGFMLQTLVPLLLIFLGAAGLARDREIGRLKLALVQGASARAVLAGHFLALWGLGLALLAAVLFTSLITSAALGGGAAIAVDRLFGFVVVHALFLGLVAGGVVAAAVWLRSARASLLTLLACWVVGTALLPRATAGVAGAAIPLPSRDAFEATLRSAREAGPDGHNPKDAMLEAAREAAMKEHGVETLEELPFNFDGVAMQIDEEFGNGIWDEHHGELREQLERQVTASSLAALLNPFQAIDHLSMALAGTDLAHDFAFQQQAEAYRRQLIAKLNHEHAYGGSRTGDWSWEAPAEFFAGLDSFHYRSPSALEATRERPFELIGLGLWAFLLLLALSRGAERLERGTLPC